MKFRKKFLAFVMLAVQGGEGRELSCEECWRQTDRFAELTIAGRNAARTMPQVEEHLNRCPDCREEFDALLCALRGAER